jgi:hypothetical protein
MEQVEEDDTADMRKATEGRWKETGACDLVASRRWPKGPTSGDSSSAFVLCSRRKQTASPYPRSGNRARLLGLACGPSQPCKSGVSVGAATAGFCTCCARDRQGRGAGPDAWSCWAGGRCQTGPTRQRVLCDQASVCL